MCVSGGSAMPVEVMKAFEKAFDCIILEGYGLSETSPVASFNHPDRERKPGSIGTPIKGVEMKVVDDDDNEVAAGRGRRDRHPRPQRDEGLLGPRGRHRGGHEGRLVPLRRHGHGGRGRLLLHRRPQEGHDHPRRLQRVPARDRGGAVRAPGGLRGRGRRRSGRLDGRGGRRGGRAQGGRGRERRRHPRVRQGARRGLQVPAQDLVPGRAPQGPDGQDPQARDQGAEGPQSRSQTYGGGRA